MTSAIKYQVVQDYESKQVLRDLLDHPESFYIINKRYSASVIMLVSYGYRVRSFEDPLVMKIYSVLDNLTEMTAPGAHAVDSFPSLKFLPQCMLGNWYNHGKKIFAHDSKIWLEFWDRLKKEVDAGTAQPSFCRDFYLSNPEKHGIDDLLAAYTCGGLIEAGSETTATTLNNWMLAMTLNPKVYLKAQAEMDAIVGMTRLPQWTDEQKLPYLRAMVKEVLRWRPVNKFGMFHATTEDDWYEDRFIPKGSVVVLNWW
jgi:hypothetical protein